jgi:hypothetical protein
MGDRACHPPQYVQSGRVTVQRDKSGYAAHVKSANWAPAGVWVPAAAIRRE